MRDRRENGMAEQTVIIVGAFALILALFLIAWFVPVGTVKFADAPAGVLDAAATTTQSAPAEPEFVVTHLPTPEPLRGIYMTACTASEKRLRDRTLENFDGTELNALVIDLKDYTGTISYADTAIDMPTRASGVRGGCLIGDLKEFLGELHDRGIYTIARITVFQDPLYASAHPELAVKSASDPSGVWRDRNGLAYVDAGAEPYWEYIVTIGKEAYAIGFDELNFDYIRYPSDGNLRDAIYSWSGGRPLHEVLDGFFVYLHEELAGSGPKLSADLFGLTTTATDDLGIGQVLEDALDNFDYVSPMVYPSHFARGYNGLANPAEHPYEVISGSMTRAVERAIAASTTPDKLRPWLQDFDLGAKYTPDMVRAQMQGTYDAGLTSWMLWNAASRYQRQALETR